MLPILLYSAFITLVSGEGVIYDEGISIDPYNSSRIDEKRKACYHLIEDYEKNPNSNYCPPMWHTVMCWPQNEANKTAILQCPEYVPTFKNPMGYAILRCGPNGIWENNTNAYGNCVDANLVIQMKLLHQKLMLEKKEKECREVIKNYSSSDASEKNGSCSPEWYAVMCWPMTFADTKVQLKCPEYVVGFNIPSGHAERICTSNSTWENQKSKLSAYTNCINTSTKLANPHYEHVNTIKLIKKIGYNVSLVSLILAFGILISMKKLKCARNHLHLNLFSSFIFRAAMCVLMDEIFTTGLLGFKKTVSEDHPFGYATWDCRLFVTVWNYSLMANYSWILMEGLYLHNLIFFALFSDHSGIRAYVIIGWGLPLPFILAWVVNRLLIDNTYCWTFFANTDYDWILRAPISFSILINFLFFIRISAVLFRKLQVQGTINPRNHDNPFGYGLKKWIKSTLVLVPLFGAYYFVFLIVSLSVETKKNLVTPAKIIWLYCDTTFTAFQGFVVAVLYCFMNGEVQTELRRKFTSLWFNQLDLGTNQSYLTQTQTRGGGGGSRPTIDHLSCHSLHSIEKNETSRPENARVNSSLL